MAPSRRATIKRFAALVCGGIAASHFHVTPIAFFAPPPLPTEEPKTSGSIQAARQASPEKEVKSREPPQKMGRAKHHLKMLASFEDIRRCHGRSRIDLEEETHTKIVFSGLGEYYPFSPIPRKTLVIEGDSKAGVLDAFKEIIQSSNQTSPIFLVPKSASGQLIGTEGKKLKALYAQSGAKVNLKKSGFEYQVEVFAPDVDAAVAVAEYILNEEDSFVDDMRDHLSTNYLGSFDRGLHNDCVIYLPMTEAQVARMIGKGGEQVRRIRSEFYVDIHTSKDERDQDGNLIVKMAGKAGDVHACHAYLLNRFAAVPDSSPQGED